MTRGHTQVKRKAESPSERRYRLGGYAKDIKLYKVDTEKNVEAKNRFKNPPYYLKGKEECQEKSFGINE